MTTEEIIEVQIVDFMTEYITDNDVPSLIELVIKAIKKVEGSKNDKNNNNTLL